MTHGTELLPKGMVSTAHGARSEWSSTLQRLAAMSDSELAAVDLAGLNLWAAQRLPGTETLNIAASLRTLAAWTDLVRANTKHWWPAFERSPESYEHSPGRFRMLALVVESSADFADECRGRKVGVVELTLHGSFDDKMVVYKGNGGTITKKNAAEFAMMIKRDVFGGRDGGLIIINSCLTGTFTKADNDNDPTTRNSLAQIIADYSGAYVLSFGGFSSGSSFADWFSWGPKKFDQPRSNECVGFDLPNRWDRNDTNILIHAELSPIMYESADDIWYLTTPNQNRSNSAAGH